MVYEELHISEVNINSSSVWEKRLQRLAKLTSTRATSDLTKNRVLVHHILVYNKYTAVQIQHTVVHLSYEGQILLLRDQI